MVLHDVLCRQALSIDILLVTSTCVDVGAGGGAAV